MTPAIGNKTSPYQLQAGTNYVQLGMGDSLADFSGIAFDLREGLHLDLDQRNRFGVNGLLRYASLSRKTKENYPEPNLSLMYLGMEGYYEVQVIPSILTGLLNIGLGANTFYSEGIHIQKNDLPLQNGAAFALSLGGGLTLGRGMFQFLVGWQPNFGLQISLQEAPSIGLNPQAFYLGASIDAVQIFDMAGGYLPYPNSLKEYFSDLSTPRVLIYGNYLNGDGKDFLLGEARATLYRSSDPANPLGFGMNMAMGIGAGAELGSEEEHDGVYFEFEEVFLNLRLPIAQGTVIQAGRFFILGQPLATPEQVFFTFTGLEDHEVPVNNHISHSHQFHHALPLSFGALRVQSHLSERWLLSLASLHDWENFFGRDGDIAAYANLAYNPLKEATVSVTGIAGEVGGKGFTNLSFQAVACLPSIEGCAITSSDSRFNAGLNYTWGQQEKNHWHSLTTYLRFNFFEELGISGRVEYFADPNQIRTKNFEHLFGATATVNVQPLDWLQFRAEARHDESIRKNAAQASTRGVGQNSFGVNAAFVF